MSHNKYKYTHTIVFIYTHMSILGFIDITWRSMCIFKQSNIFINTFTQNWRLYQSWTGLSTPPTVYNDEYMKTYGLKGLSDKLIDRKIIELVER